MEKYSIQAISIKFFLTLHSSSAASLGFYDLEGRNIFMPQFKEIFIFHRPKNTYVCAVSDNKTSIYNFATKTYTALDHELDVFNPKDQALFF